MIRVTRRRTSRRDERGVEAAAILFVIPVLIVLVLALVDIGVSLSTRMLVENAARDGARGVAADGGFYNPRAADDNMSLSNNWNHRVLDQIWDNKTKTCEFGRCEKKPQVTCSPRIVAQSGELVWCRIVYYPKAINGGLLNGPIGMGMGNLVPDKMTITQWARAETGTAG